MIHVPSATQGNYFFVPNASLIKKIIKDYLAKIPDEERTLITNTDELIEFKNKFLFSLFLHPRTLGSEIGGMSEENTYIHITYYPDTKKLKLTNPWTYLKQDVLPQLETDIKSVFFHEITHAIDNIRSYDKDQDDYKDIYQLGPKSMKNKKDQYTTKQVYGSGYGELNARSIEAKQFIEEKINALSQILIGLSPNDTKEEYQKAIKSLDIDQIYLAIKDADDEKDIKKEKLLMYAIQRMIPNYLDPILGIASSIQTNNPRMFIDSVADIEELTFWYTLPQGSKEQKEFRQKAVGRLLDVFEDLKEEYKENPKMSHVLQMINKKQGIS
jgi:hypothetical protein